MLQNRRLDAFGGTTWGLPDYGGIQAGLGAGRADMTHPFAPAATDASISGGFAGIYGGTPCFFQFPIFVPGTCIRAEASINLSNISGTSPPNFGGEIMRAKIRSFAVVDAQLVMPLRVGALVLPGYTFNIARPFPPPVLMFVGLGPAVGNTVVDFAGAATSDTRFGFNAQAGLIFPIAPNAAVRANYFYVNLGSTPIPTAAGRAHVDLWAQGINVGLEFRW